jgi:hypothetical protein
MNRLEARKKFLEMVEKYPGMTPRAATNRFAVKYKTEVDTDIAYCLMDELIEVGEIVYRQVILPADENYDSEVITILSLPAKA